MAQPSPYYRTEEEKQALIKLRDEFGQRFEEPPPRNLTIVLAGEQGLGKTHLMCTIAGEQYGHLYIGDSEHRAQTVVDKFRDVDPDVPIHRATITCYADAVAFVKWAKKEVKPPAVIGLDSGTDLDKFAEEQYLIHEDKEMVGKPINHPKMNRYVFKLMDELKFSGFTVVMTSKMKDEYLGENRTGRKLLRIFKDVPYRADLVVQLAADGKRYITKSGWSQRQMAEIPSRLTLPEIIEYAKTLDMLPVQDAAPSASALAVGSDPNNGGAKTLRR